MDDTVTTRLIAGDKTQEVGLTVDTIMKEKREVIDVLANAGRRSTDGESHNIERRLLIKELLITAYITGFFAGTSSAHRDLEKTSSN
jgi:hypothetical protein